MPKVDTDGVVQEFVNKPGSHILIENEYFIDKETGEQLSKPGRQVDWFAYIQASRDQCDLHQIVARYLSGDNAVVNVNSPIYGDVASMPRNVNEIHDLGDRVQAGYDRLPDEIKSIFGNSFDNFYQAVLQGTVDSKINAYAAAKAEQAAKQVKEVVPDNTSENKKDGEK